MIVAAVLLTAAAILLGARSLTYTPWYQDWLYARMPLKQLAAAARTQQGNPILLYYYGKALNKQGRFTEALPLLEHAAGLDPDEARLRGEWSTAQLAGGYITGAFGQLTQYVRTHPNSAEGRLLLGRFYLAQNSHVRSTEELEQAVRLDPHLGEGWSLLAGERLQQGDPVVARDAARKAVELRPNSAVDHMMLASLLATTDRTGALREYAEAVALSPKEPGYLCEYARVLLKDGNAKEIAQAEQLARRVIALDPHTMNAYAYLGRALVQEGKPGEAIGPLKIAASTPPPGTPRSTLPANAPEQFLDPVEALDLARAYRAGGGAAEAGAWERMYLLRQQRREEERRLTDAMRFHPEQAEPHRQMALYLARKGDVEGVAKNLARVLHSAPDAPRVLVEAANLLATAGYGEQAAPLAHRAALFSKSNPAAYEAWGNAFLAMDQPHEAAVKYAQAAGWQPEKMPLYHRRIEEYYRRRKQHPSEAERSYQQAVELERASLGAAFNADKLQALLERAVALEPKDTDYRRALLRLLVRRHELTEAARTARELLALSPEDGLGHAMLAVLQLQQAASASDLTEIKAHLKAAEMAATEETSVMSTVHYGQGILALREQRPQEAVRLLRLAASEDPSADAVYYQLAQAESMAGNVAAAGKARAELAEREDRKQRELDLLNRIVAKPDDRRRYVEAIRFYGQCGMKAQAAAVSASMRQRFGVSRS